jgi:DNA polymerase V
MFMQTEKIQVIDLKPNVAAILKAHTSAALRLPLFETRVPAGFPSPGDDYHPIKIDLRKALEPHPNATFFVRVVDNSMIEEGNYNDDLLVVDRAEEPVHGDIVVVQVEREFYVRRLYHDVCGPRLCAGNPKYRDILITDTTDWEVWGKVIFSIRPH